MKHIFIINSHTTFLSSIGTINLLKLEEKDIVFIYIRKYSNNIIKIPYSTFDLSELFNECYNIIHILYIDKSLIKKVDSFINENINSAYALYAPHIAHAFFQLFYTNSSCKYASYIQEGAIPFRTAYLTNPSFCIRTLFALYNKFILRTNRIWRPRRWYVKGQLKKQKTLSSYSTSPNFFKYLPSNNYTIKWPRITLDISINSNIPIFIFDGFVQNKCIEKEFYLSKCKSLIDQYHQENNYIRFHPAQGEEEKEFILNCFDSLGVKRTIMEANVPFELILSSKSNLTVIGLGSSLLYFARDFGHNVICKDYWLTESKLYNKYKEDYGFDFFQDSNLK